MIEQTLFALPFALLGVLFAGGGTIGIWFWVIVAMAAARTSGMSFNRVIDADWFLFFCVICAFKKATR